MLGQNGSTGFKSGEHVWIGDALINVGRQITVSNKGTKNFDVQHSGNKGASRYVTLGPNGTGYFNKEQPVRIGYVVINIESETLLRVVIYDI